MNTPIFARKSLQWTLLTGVLFISCLFASTPALGEWFEEITPDTPEIPVPEPGTIILFITAFGIFGYGRWRKRKNVAAQTSGSSANMVLFKQDVQQERMVMIGEMASEVMHDVKNSLTAIRTCTEVLGYDDLEPEERDEFLQLVAHEIDRVVGMTQELLEFAYGYQRTLKLQTCFVERFVHDILSLIECDFAARKISIHTDLPYTGEIQVDIEKMKRVFMNIIANARDAMPEGGIFTITSRLVNDMVQFEFTDTGCGMSPKLQVHFLEPLVTKGKPHGTGLGMAIVKDILDEHHAYIDVESIVAQGTTLRILLPRISAFSSHDLQMPGILARQRTNCEI